MTHSNVGAMVALLAMDRLGRDGWLGEERDLSPFPTDFDPTQWETRTRRYLPPVEQSSNRKRLALEKALRRKSRQDKP